MKRQVKDRRGRRRLALRMGATLVDACERSQNVPSEDVAFKEKTNAGQMRSMFMKR
jgi:hypothetical protein